MKNLKRILPVIALTSVIAGLAACAPGNPRPDPGPMGSTATGSDADIPDRNSQSTPIEKPL
ncbi:MAG: hypothetical protein Q7S99_09135 [Parvibaculum sp.]|nr:hypothetical protein [Parvibaculum sp.]|tara:strand:- start:569 stop:751 length:183 start_codon:yes stop_codon:yes gene_type:complete